MMSSKPKGDIANSHKMSLPVPCRKGKKQVDLKDTDERVETNITLRKKKDGCITKKNTVIVSPTTPQATPSWRTRSSNKSEKSDSDVFSDTFSDGICVNEQTLSRSMDSAIKEADINQEMKETIEKLRLELSSSQNELDNLILENNDLRKEVTKLNRENDTLKTLLSNTPPKKPKINYSNSKSSACFIKVSRYSYSY